MNISYEISTMLYWWRETNLSFEQECEYLKSLGFGVEVFPNIKDQTECRYERHNWPRLMNATKDMLVTLRSRNDKPTLQNWQEQIECAKMLNADIIADLRSFGLDDINQVNGYDFVEKIVDMAKTLDVKLSIETGDLERIKNLGDKFDSIDYCLDTGFGNIDQNHSFKQYVDQLAERTTHLHLSDNYGRKNDHQPPGLEGGISRENWDYLLESLEKHDNDVIATLEMFPAMPDVMIRQGCKFLFDELNWPARPQCKPGSVKVYNPT